MGFDRLKEFHGDLHIHTCLSPCADLEMSPRKIVKEARRKGLDFIGICDHNSAENVGAAKKAGTEEKIVVLGGMELTTREEVHILAFFEETTRLEALQEALYGGLPDTDDEEIYGNQVLANAEDEVIGFNRKLLMGAAEITLKEAVAAIHRLDGLAIASHINREGFGIIAQLGFIPRGLNLDAVEIMTPVRKDPSFSVGDFPVVISSDAHYLDDIGRTHTRFLLEEITVCELRKSFRREAGRRIIP